MIEEEEEMSATATNTITQSVNNNNNNNSTSGTTATTSSNSSNSSSSNSSTSSSVTNNNINDSANSNNRSRCNLIVNYLPQSLKENDFCQLFAKIGPIKTCKLMYDRQTGYSFGYGFVDFQNADDAAKAIETLNGFQLEHKRLKVAYARPNSEDTKNTNIYIKNLPNTYDEQNLLDLFSQYGEVVQVRLLRDQVTAFSKRVGFVIMSTKQMAQQAIDHLDNQIPPNGTEPIHVKYADEEGKKRQAPRGGGGSSGGSLNGYFNSGYKHNNHHGNNHHNGGGFQNHGKMKSRGQNGQNRYNPMGANFAAYQAANVMAGFDAFLNGASGSNHHHQQHHNYNMNSNNHFSSSHHHHHNNNNNNNNNNHHHHNNNSRHNSHHNNHNGHHSHHQNGGASTTTIQLTQNSSLSGLNDADIKGGHIIYVYGIGPHANESDLYSLFQNVGRILRVNVIKNQKTGLGKGYGFVVFEHYEEACFAVQQMNGYVYHARPLQVQLNACQIET